MPLKPPSFFDDLERMRKPSRAFDPNMNFSPVVGQLIESCKAFRFLAISPQNLSEPALLLKAVVVRDKMKFLAFVDPIIVQRSGNRPRYESCGNIYLMRNGRKFHTAALVARPTRIAVAYRTVAGESKRAVFQDTLPPRSTENGFIGAFCHEVDHLEGRLIVDHARESLISRIYAGYLAESDEEKWKIANSLPSVLVREGDKYILRHGVEFAGMDAPPVSPDVLYMCNRFWRLHDLQGFKVPREGELLPVRLSELMEKLRK